MFRFAIPRLFAFCVVIAGAIANAQDARPEVLLIRGGAGYWPGVTGLAQELSDHGFAPQIIMGMTHSLHARSVADQYHAGRRSGPITIVGYSSGADYACRMSRLLGERGVPVSTLVLIESTLGTPVPENVDYCVNIYESRPATDWIPAFRGIPVQANSPQTNLYNLDSRSNGELQWLTNYNHFTVVSNAESHVMLRNLLLQRQALQTSQPSVGTDPELVPPPPVQASAMPEVLRPVSLPATPKSGIRTLLRPLRTPQ